MNDEESLEKPPPPAPSPQSPKYLNLLIACGWLGLIASSVCVSLMSSNLHSGALSSDSDSGVALLLVARLCGMSSFVVGIVCLLNERWTSGALLLFSSMVLPVISLLVAGSL